MDNKLNGLLRHYALVLMLLEVQWTPVLPAPTAASCDIDNTTSLTNLLIHQAKKLLDEYIKFHGPMSGSLPDGVPNSTISGISLSEKLQDIYINNVLFDFHLSKVKQYQNDTWDNSQSVLGPLSRVKGNLANHLAKIKTILINIDSLPTTPTPPQLSHSDDYEKKVYGWGVIVSLKDWLTQVKQVLTEGNGTVCQIGSMDATL